MFLWPCKAAHRWVLGALRPSSLCTGSNPHQFRNFAQAASQLRASTWLPAVYNNSATLNLQRLLLVVARQLAKCAARGGSVADANAVFLARAVLKDLTEQLNAEQLLGFVELPQGLLSAPAAAPGGSIAGAAAREGGATTVAAGAAAPTVPTVAAGAAGAAAADLRAELGGELLGSADGSLLTALCKAALQVLANKPDLR